MACLVLTLQDLLKMGLGVSEPDYVNLAILHNFLKIVIEKLGIQKQTVEFTGPQVSDIRQRLCHARNPIMEFQNCFDDSPDAYTRSYSNDDLSKNLSIEKDIHNLTATVERLEAELKGHFEEMNPIDEPGTRIGVLKLKKPTIIKTIEEDDCFSSDCEDLCTPCDEGNRIASDLLKNSGFVTKLMNRSTTPMIEHFSKLTTVLGELHEKFQNFLNTVEDEYRKTPSIEYCFVKLDTLKKKIDRHQLTVDTSIEEVIDMLTIKMHKVHLPALKKYITDRMDEIEKQLKALTAKEGCPDPAGLIMCELQCLCCTTHVCQEDPMDMYSLKPVKKRGPGGRPCIPREIGRSCGGDHTVIRPDEKSLRHSNLIDDFGTKKVRIGTDYVEYFKGSTGAMYRLAPPCI